ncbi:MAG: hypothetical protein AMJ84_06545 [Acidithiobacillales bacterium SM23_46]|jgi:uncharacterized membrane protein YedE/YeeE|nr:MAG: hypothetical protein AMJ84_06545 [Acidithiobacillales bacterium SM23_46]
MIATSRQVHIRYGATGLILGIVLSSVGFTDFGEVHKMFTFTDLRLLFVFAGAVALAAAAFALLARQHRIERKRIHPGTIPGSILFGMGWAVTGACPAIALVQFGQGYLPAAITILGVVGGVALYQAVHRAFFRWDSGACQ